MPDEDFSDDSSAVDFNMESGTINSEDIKNNNLDHHEHENDDLDEPMRNV
jgi:hypothetical protein